MFVFCFTFLTTGCHQVGKPVNITTGLLTFKHLHDEKRRKRDKSRYFDQYKVDRAVHAGRVRETGNICITRICKYHVTILHDHVIHHVTKSVNVISYFLLSELIIS